jgi:hypothetical protein
MNRSRKSYFWKHKFRMGEERGGKEAAKEQTNSRRRESAG